MTSPGVTVAVLFSLPATSVASWYLAMFFWHATISPAPLR
jgi:hypothetical protein